MAGRSEPADTAELIHNDLSNMLTGDRNELQSMVDFYMTMMNKIESLEIEARNSFRTSEPILERLNLMEIEIQYLQNENSDLRFKLAQVEDTSKNMYLRIEGLSEGQKASLIKQVVSIFSRTGIACSETDVDYARRVGKYQEGYTRPILVRLNHESKRNQILYNPMNVNKNKPPNTPLVWINDEVSDETRRLRKTVRDIASLAKINGNEGLKVHSDGVILDNDKFHLNDLDLLPPRLSVDKSKSRTDDTDIFFQGENSPFSNFYTAKFTDDEGYI